LHPPPFLYSPPLMAVAYSRLLTSSFTLGLCFR
jgi:hypothetical protein